MGTEKQKKKQIDRPKQRKNEGQTKRQTEGGKDTF